MPSLGPHVKLFRNGWGVRHGVCSARKMTLDLACRVLRQQQRHGIFLLTASTAVTEGNLTRQSQGVKSVAVQLECMLQPSSSAHALRLTKCACASCTWVAQQLPPTCAWCSYCHCSGLRGMRLGSPYGLDDLQRPAWRQMGTCRAPRTLAGAAWFARLACQHGWLRVGREGLGCFCAQCRGCWRIR